MAKISSINGNPIYLPEVDYLSRYHQHSSPFGLSLFDGESFVYNGSDTPVSVGERASYYADWFDQITAGSGTRAVVARLSDIENYPTVAKNESFDVFLYVEVADESVSETLSVRLSTTNGWGGGSAAQATVSVQKSGVYRATLVWVYRATSPQLGKYRYLMVEPAVGNALNNVSKVALLREATLGNFLPDGSIGSRQIADGSIGDDKLETSYLKSADAYTKAEVDSAISNAVSGLYHYKGSVASADKLPASPATGDVYNIETASEYGAAGASVAWNGSAWDSLGEVFSITAISNTEIDGILTK